MRLRRVNLGAAAGFTLVETTIVLALIGLLTTVLVAGTGPQLKNERFAGQVRVFADDLRQAQTHAYTVQTGTCAVGTCYWRGNLMTLTQQSATDPNIANYYLMLLQGDDYSKYTTATGQTLGVTSTQAQRTNRLSGIHLTAITIPGLPVVADGMQVNLAFLAPDGKGYVCVGTTVCDPAASSLSSYVAKTVKFELSDTATKLISYVTYDPATGSITITAS